MAPSLALALGGGGARGLAHIHVFEALDELGVRPCRIAGSSIGAILGAAYAAGMRGTEIRAYLLESFARKRLVVRRLWRTRPTRLAEFMAEGGVRFGQMNPERVVGAFMPDGMARTFEELQLPLGVMATDFYARQSCEIETGDLCSALAASSALPAIFRPVRRDGRILIDGGLYDPLPFDRLLDRADIVLAVDVNGGPEGDPAHVPTPMEAMLGASQLMMQSIIETKLKMQPPQLLFRPPVSRYKVLDFFKAGQILDETAGLKEEVKRSLALLLDPAEASGRGDGVGQLAV